jgi:hypothetical protein
MKSLEEIKRLYLTVEEEEEEDITDMTVKQWGVYVDPETGKIVSKDIQ